MRRRAFIEATALGTVAVGTVAVGTGAVGAGCGGIQARAALADSEARVLAARLERGMRRLSDQPFGSMIQGPPGTRPDLTERVLRLTIESLVVLDVLRSIPEGAAIPAGLAEVLAPRMVTLDRTIHTHYALLSRMPIERRRNLDGRIRERPELAMDVGQWIDRHAAELGVPADNRVRLRHSAMTLGARLRRQSTNAVVDDCTNKLDELFARQAAPLPSDLADATARVVDVMWQQVGESTDLGSPVSPPPRVQIVSAEALADPLVVPDRFGAASEMMDPTEPVQWNDSWARPGDEELRLGAIMMPLGLVTCGVLLIVGIIVVIAGSVQNGDWDGRSHASDATVQ